MRTSAFSLLCASRSGRWFLAGIVVFFLLFGGGAAWLVGERLFGPLTVQPIPPTATLPLYSNVPTSTPRPTSTPLPVPTFTATPAPHTWLRLVWSRQAAGVYLRRDPAGKVLTTLDNGTWVLTGDLMPANGITWTLVTTTSQATFGWVAEDLVYTVDVGTPANPARLYRVNNPEGAYLRQKPDGALLSLLPDGSPVIFVEEVQAGETTWVHAKTLDGENGWIAGHLLELHYP